MFEKCLKSLQNLEVKYIFVLLDIICIHMAVLASEKGNVTASKSGYPFFQTPRSKMGCLC